MKKNILTSYVKITLTFENQSCSFLEQLIFQLQENKQFWKEYLSYEVEFKLKRSTKSICIYLSCDLWFNNKISTFLDYPLELECYKKTDSLQIKFLNEIQIKAIFYKIIHKDKYFQKNEEVNVFEIKNLLNQFFASLLISQLEFKFPLVFSSLVRKRIAIQEKYFAPISYSLTNSIKLIPIIIKIISDDRTSTTAFVLLLPTKKISFKMALNIL